MRLNARKSQPRAHVLTSGPHDGSRRKAASQQSATAAYHLTGAANSYGAIGEC